MGMFCCYLADVVVVLHLMVGIFAPLGGLLVFLWYRMIWLHIPIALTTAFVEFTGSVCPATVLEKWLRVQGGEVVYSGGFSQYYIAPMLHVPAITRGMFLCHGILVVTVNLLIYWQILRRRYKQFG